MSYELIHGDCIEEMNHLIDKDVKVDMILTDPPYGTTQCKWDSIIPFNEMWNALHLLSNKHTPILLFGTEPFSSHLRLSNEKEYRYDWVWDKQVGTNFLNANRMPLPCHEIISVFYQKLPIYNPQKKYTGVKRAPRAKGVWYHNTYNTIKEQPPWVDDGYRFPLSVIQYKNVKGETSLSKRVHPTQKPVELLEYFIKTYTNEGNIVLDFTMGSGSTGVACANTNRNFIGIELEEEYYNIAKQRIEEACNTKQTKLI